MKALILLAFFVGCNGYSYIIPASFRTPGICFFNGRILPKGNSQVPMVCQNTNCRDDGSIVVDGCGRISLPNCTLIEDKSSMKSYPDCCEMTYQCVDPNGITYTKEWNQLYPNPSPPAAEENSDGQIVPSEKEPKQDYKMVSPFLLQLMLFV
ncbi:uncharacterized protein LOC129912494 [Episyrphus balteatus]|uniref:uncharacterized protein LOC129912494 n=1 Tax=Episyrphus balteatus TaxID=286459 RepID=UPI002485B88D|nr:uncharacterized protein LOC129912494 [Episyrphus balteatus]